MQQRLTILGSTGSIGDSTLDIVARHPERFSVFGLSAHRNIDKLLKQCLRFTPRFAVVRDAALAAQLQTRLKAAGSRTEVAYGEAALIALANAAECDTVVAAIVGAAGLAPTLAAACASKRILLANKEALVMSGRLFMEAVCQHNALLFPVDSEHNAIYQCLSARAGVEKIILTASGGPFRTRELASLAHVTPDEACAHPNWRMGRKISVDSATMMNKGLEVIEAHWLFNVPINQIEVLIHPQSVIHSMVSYVDGSVLAQLGNPDMRTPIAHALAFPDRIAAGVEPLDLALIATLSFERPELERFPCLTLAIEALRQGGVASAVLNAANEVAVEAFLQGATCFTSIAAIVANVLERIAPSAVHTLDDVLAADAQARRLAFEEISALAV
ncbi:1-deoxy-D-xylulose-5-phosphate reductoisomerase [Mycoavidus sp. SF9855]|uniref:1-deoxy-D-xylulose-5-phosphate reductoisomerase n=1 Tax=Mycoavidus sp. SF9855 TaxID=2968475 RepID=UPI00211C015C|nr:1-deoxy-D-xylulose-5-phosphate reductoisomerase [Mycoavidus sp. SF9855]UUM22088.1 1-deoxy-D-xylulose-5-phosphate reductoisomerase [Mycoavidus sp. SF9855]